MVIIILVVQIVLFLECVEWSKKMSPLFVFYEIMKTILNKER